MRTRQNAIASPAKKNRKKKTSSLATQKQATGKKKSKATPAKKTRRKKKDKNSAPLALRILCLGIEITSLFFVAITSLVILIGYGAYYFSGTSLLYNLLPFAMGTLLVVSLAIGLFLGGRRMRPFLLNLHPYVPSCCAVALALGAILLLSQRDFSIPFDNFRLLVGGKEEARMIYLGVLSGLVHSSWANAAGLFPGSNRFCIVDIGGGSTELIVGDRDHIYFAESYKLGAARLTQRFFQKVNQQRDENRQIDEFPSFKTRIIKIRIPEMRETAGFTGVTGFGE